jgi:hypothetical protein
MIRKIRGGYRVVSELGRITGTDRTKAETEKRVRQVEMFKHMRRKR